jgi:hypothetical protein
MNPGDPDNYSDELRERMQFLIDESIRCAKWIQDNDSEIPESNKKMAPKTYAIDMTSRIHCNIALAKGGEELVGTIGVSDEDRDLMQAIQKAVDNGANPDELVKLAEDWELTKRMKKQDDDRFADRLNDAISKEADAEVDPNDTTDNEDIRNMIFGDSHKPDDGNIH